MSLRWTFRGIPTLYYGSEIEFQAGRPIDCGPSCPPATTGRAYYGDKIAGTFTASDFGVVGSASGEGISGSMAFKRRYTAGGVDSFALVAAGGPATFTGLPDGTYVDAVTGDTKTVGNGTLSASVSGKGNLRVYVLNLPGNPAPGKIGAVGPFCDSG